MENDGFGLGAQRRAIEKNDLPQVQAELTAYLNALRSQSSPASILTKPSQTTPASIPSTSSMQIVPKEKIAANGDYNLSGERYREGVAANHSFPLVSLGEAELFQVESGGTPKSDVEEYWGGGIPWATLVDLPATDFISEITATKRTISEKGLKESSAKMIPANSVIVSTRATIGRIAINRVPIATNQGFKNVVIKDSARAVPEYVALALTKLVPTMQAWATGGTFAEISKTKFCELQIPLPPLVVQREIVAEIEGYQKVINGARAVLDHYRPHIPIHPDWPMVRLEDVTAEDCSLSYGIVQPGDEFPDGLPIVRPVDLTSNLIRLSGLKKINPKAAEGYKRTALQGGEILLCVRGTTGVASVAAPELAGANVTRGIVPIRFNPALTFPLFGLIAICSEFVQSQIRLKTYGATLQQINIADIRELQIPLPPLPEQRALAAEIEAEQALVGANRELLQRFGQKIQTTLARIWGEEKPAGI